MSSRCDHTRAWPRVLCFWLAYTCYSSTAQAQTIAYWLGHRAALIRDSVFVQGGWIGRGNWTVSDGQWTNVNLDNVGGFPLYKLDLAHKFNLSNAEQSLLLLDNTQANGQESNYLWGSMFVDANGFVVFGGVADESASENSSGVTSVQLYPWPYNDSERTDPVDFYVDPPALTPSVTTNPSLWHRCCGSSASTPNAHQSFYFSGMLGANGNVLWYESSDNGTNHPTILADDMIICNTTSLKDLACRTENLPGFVKPRAEAALVWLPVGQQGSLVLFGGVETPGDIYLATPAQGFTLNATVMTDILIYDIAVETWHSQSIFGTSPPQTAAFCTTLGISKDQSSFNIYMYGGYDGTYTSDDPDARDTVWVLSLPSFTWIKVYNGSASHGRQGHQCVSPYPNQMVTIGGTSAFGAQLTSASIIDVFDMNKLAWTSTYDPLNWSDYKVPKIISQEIGGNENGGAKLPTTGLDPAVISLFKTRYNGKIPIYYPYAKKTLVHYIKSLPEWIRTIVGVLAYLLLSSAAFSCVMLLWRRRYLKAAGLSGADLGPGHSLIAWAQGLYGREIKLPTENKANDKIVPLTIPYFDDVDTVSTRTRVSTDVNSIRTSRWSEQNSLFNEVELRTFISTDRND